MEQSFVHISTGEFIHGAVRALDVDVFEHDIRACRVTTKVSCYSVVFRDHHSPAAPDIAADAAVFTTTGAHDVLHEDIADGQLRRESVAQSQILLTVALRDFDRVVGVCDCHGVVGDVVDSALASASLEVT